MQSNTHCDRNHVFYVPKRKAENRVLVILIVSVIYMSIEIVGGIVFYSAALLADGFHMLTHTLAYGIAAIAYYAARKYSRCGEFTFGTWKIEILGAYTSGVLLLFTSFIFIGEVFTRFFSKKSPLYEEALFIAMFGLIINLFSLYVLRGEEDVDHNLKGAILHTLSDILTSVLAIVGLLLGKFFGLWYIDPIVGIIGFLIMIKWSIGIMKETSSILLDREAKNPLIDFIIEALESDGKTKVYDIHLLQVLPNKYVCIVGLESKEYNLEYYENILSRFGQIVHATIEIRKI